VRFALTSDGYDARQQAAASGTCNTADTTWATTVRLADGQTLSGASPTGVVVSPAVTVMFDALGRTNLGSDQTVSVGPFSLTIRAESGFVQVP
jgi:hypothetical protein